MLYLLAHLAQPKQSNGLSHTPWTEYVRFLPRPIPVPTMWTEPERLLLNGTSLEVCWHPFFGSASYRCQDVLRFTCVLLLCRLTHQIGCIGSKTGLLDKRV